MRDETPHLNFPVIRANSTLSLATRGFRCGAKPSVQDQPGMLGLFPRPNLPTAPFASHSPNPLGAPASCRHPRVPTGGRARRHPRNGASTTPAAWKAALPARGFYDTLKKVGEQARSRPFRAQGYGQPVVSDSMNLCSSRSIPAGSATAIAATSSARVWVREWA